MTFETMSLKSADATMERLARGVPWRKPVAAPAPQSSRIAALEEDDAPPLPEPEPEAAEAAPEPPAPPVASAKVTAAEPLKPAAPARRRCRPPSELPYVYILVAVVLMSTLLKDTARTFRGATEQRVMSRLSEFVKNHLG